MRRYYRIGLITALIGAFVAAPVGARVLSGAGGATLVVVESASATTLQTTASLTTPVNANGWRSGTMAAQNKTGNSLGVIPNAALPAQASSAAAASALSSYLQPLLGSEATTLQAAMKGTTDEGALYTYTESIPLTSGGNAQVAGLMWVPKTGPYDWLGVNATGGTFTLLYGSYEQSQAAYGLPSGWTMPNAGDFIWELMQVSTANSNTLMTPISYNGSVIHTVTTGGVFDAPRLAGSVIDNCTAEAGNPLMCNQPNPLKTYPAKVNGQTVSYDPNVGYNLLVSQEVSPLLKSTGASAALIDYGRTVQPVYTQSSNGTQTAATAVSVASRTFTGGCGASSLANSGNIGFLLNEVNSQYYVDTSGTSSLLGNTTTNLISPTQSFSQSANLPSGAQYSQYISDIVNPFGGGQVYNWQNDTVNGLPASDYVYVAPLTQSTGASNGQVSETFPGGITIGLCSQTATYSNYLGGSSPSFSDYVVVVNGQVIPSGAFNSYRKSPISGGTMNQSQTYLIPGTPYSLNAFSLTTQAFRSLQGIFQAPMGLSIYDGFSGSWWKMYLP